MVMATYVSHKYLREATRLEERTGANSWSVFVVIYLARSDTYI